MENIPGLLIDFFSIIKNQQHQRYIDLNTLYPALICKIPAFCLLGNMLKRTKKKNQDKRFEDQRRFCFSIIKKNKTANFIGT